MDNEILIKTLCQAHFEAAMNNNNVSSAMVKQVASVGKGLPEAIAAACLTLGEVHGPTTQARRVLFEEDDDNVIRSNLEQGNKVPGFGNAFFKNGVDPAFKEISDIIYKDHPEVGQRIDDVGELIVEVRGNRVYPNAAAFTASVAHILDIPWHTEVGLLIMGRTPAWIQQFTEFRYQG